MIVCNKCNEKANVGDRFCRKCFNTLPREKPSFLSDSPKGPQSSTAESSQASTAESPQASTVESPQASTAESFQASTIESSQAPTAESSQASTAESSQASISESSQASTAESSQASTAESPLVSTAKNSQVSEKLHDNKYTASSQSTLLSAVAKSLKESMEQDGIPFNENRERRIIVSHPALLNYKHFAILFAILIISIIANVAFLGFIGFLSFILLLLLGYVKMTLHDKGFIDSFRGEYKYRYYSDGRKEHRRWHQGNWIVSDVSDQSVVNEIAKWTK